MQKLFEQQQQCLRICFFTLFSSDGAAVSEKNVDWRMMSGLNGKSVLVMRYHFSYFKYRYTRRRAVTGSDLASLDESQFLPLCGS